GGPSAKETAQGPQANVPIRVGLALFFCIVRDDSPLDRPRIHTHVLILASSSAQAFATAEFGVLSPRDVAHPPASINSRCLHESTFWNSASFAPTFGCCMNLATQPGVSATTTAALERSAAIRSAVLPRVQPNPEKPMIMIPIAPTTTPPGRWFKPRCV